MHIHKVLKSMVAPRLQIFNTFTVNGDLETFNIDGAGFKHQLNEKFVVVRNQTKNGDIIGCTAKKLL